MTDERRDRERQLGPEDAAFVHRLADAYAPPPVPPQRKVAFRAALDRRIERERRGLPLPLLGAVAAACVALALALGGELPGGTSIPRAPGTATAADPTQITAEDALLALVTSGSEEDRSKELPEDYEAIESLFLGEV